MPEDSPYETTDYGYDDDPDPPAGSDDEPRADDAGDSTVSTGGGGRSAGESGADDARREPSGSSTGGDRSDAGRAGLLDLFRDFDRDRLFDDFEDVPRSDPVKAAFAGERELYGIATWEARSPIDRFAAALYRLLAENPRRTLIRAVGVFLLLEAVAFAIILLIDPRLAGWTLVSIVPALLLAVYLWSGFGRERERPKTLAITFLLGGIGSGLAAAVNTSFSNNLGLVPLVGTLAFFVFVVAPGEELVKLLSVRVFAYRSREFDRVIDGAVYGAFAGLGFATAENIVYILNNAESLGVGTIVFARLFAAPGHVVYSATAGYYLGIARFDRERRGPIVVKGLLIASIFHALYNVLVTSLPGALFLVGVLLYVVLLGYLLLKMRRYHALHRRVVDVSADAESVADTPARSAPDTSSNVDAVTQLTNLQYYRETGLLTDEEFERVRRRLVDRL